MCTNIRWQAMAARPEAQEATNNPVGQAQPYHPLRIMPVISEPSQICAMSCPLRGHDIDKELSEG